MVSQNSSAAVQRQMQDIRGDLAAHADEAVQKARTKFDWRHYVANYPWVTLGAAAAMGYLLVPRRARSRACDPGAATADRVAQARQPSPLSGVVAGMISVATATIVREGMSFVAHSVKEWLEPHHEMSSRNPVQQSN